MLKSLSLVAALLLSAISASPTSKLYPRDPCAGNTPTTRSKWCNYSVDTDYTAQIPDTGVTREYWLEITDAVVSPDGFTRPAIAVNGSIPGPTLIADWGDTVVVHVSNKLTTSKNGTSVHFHGIRQRNTNQADGVVSITQCPTAVGETETYTWRAEQYGTTWYHSHFAVQAWEGVYGAIVINGPATENYDEDLGPLILSDWSRNTVDQLAFYSKRHLIPPFQDSGLINGVNVNPNGAGGKRHTVQFKAGKSYRLRLLNAAIDTHFKFMIDNHHMTVIAVDLVPVQPYNTTVIDIAIAQRYDVIVTADQGQRADNFWIRAIPQLPCSLNNNPEKIRGIVYYGNAPSTPSTSSYEYLPSCSDESEHRTIVPHVSKSPRDLATAEKSSQSVALELQNNFYMWTLNGTSMEVDWRNPTLTQVLNGQTAFERNDGVIELPDANVMFYVVIHTLLPIPHPVHLHGHDFFVLAQGTGVYVPGITPLNTNNPLRRDTAVLPGAGYLVLGFETDNPGAWLMHCHIGFHVSEGFALQFIERRSEIAGLTDTGALDKTCAGWRAYQDANAVHQDDSGV
ncbi:Cupredoxin [Cordyceps fumosorosea ARSEF 2679]|uniref:laccase n=1 Tax=Cordyceps fumosorosea (strain ARSEF 2679) TaxID=1081104 RepID=A0A167LQI5_CORFA|nr:Cupredoxin [Cordyceps fumosorosea ARSEF 2679]OAA53376.1 Cupredoxin [Cordyceps fumosorosea ARSEF 2679]